MTRKGKNRNKGDSSESNKEDQAAPGPSQQHQSTSGQQRPQSVPEQHQRQAASGQQRPRSEPQKQAWGKGKPKSTQGDSSGAYSQQRPQNVLQQHQQLTASGQQRPRSEPHKQAWGKQQPLPASSQQRLEAEPKQQNWRNEKPQSTQSDSGSSTGLQQAWSASSGQQQASAGAPSGQQKAWGGASSGQQAWGGQGRGQSTGRGRGQVDQNRSKRPGGGQGDGQSRGQDRQPQPQDFPSMPATVVSAHNTSSQQQTVPVQQDVPVQAPNMTTITTGMRQMTVLDTSSSGLTIPVRKELRKGGTKGRKFRVGTNMMQLHFGNAFPNIIYHYDIDIQPARKKYLYRRIFLAAMNTLFPNQRLDLPFDGKKSAYSSKILQITEPCSTKVLIKDDDKRDCEYTVSIQMANKLDASWLKTIGVGLQLTDERLACIQALNIILNTAPLMNSVQIGRSFFTPPKGRATNLGGGMDLWLGLFQSAIVGWKPFLNIDVMHKGVFREQSLIDLIKVVCFEKQSRGRNQQPQRPEQQQLTMQVIQDRGNYENILSTIKGLRVSTILNRVKERSRQVVKGLANKRPIEDFFTDAENRQISVQQYFLQKKNYKIQYPDLPCVILNSKNAHVPMKVCWVESGQSSDEVDTTNLVREAATDTTTRKRKIMDVFGQARHNNNPTIKEFDISINGHFEEVTARVLTPPMLYYNQNRPVQVSKGVWRTLQFRKPENFISANGSWTILNLNSQYTKMNMIYEFSKCFRSEGQKLGMIIGEPKAPFDERVSNRVRDIETYLLKQKKEGVKFVIVVFPDRIKSTYATIKQIAELKVGILTQCIKSFTLERKISQGDSATINNILQKVNAKLNGINHSFMTVNSDGVSEGQFKEVMIKEVQAIRRACKSMDKDGGYQPPITFLVVQKLHHTRLFPLKREDTDDRNMNVKAGTIVDEEITHPSHIDFYLVSHASIQGSARPTKYRCLWNDCDMSQDEIEELTYYLCHMFSRCARSVSYPAPTYYAHLAAFRARHLIHEYV